MSTIRQKKLANALVENLQADKPLNKGELVESVGYSPASAEKKTAEILNSKGVINELHRLNFSEEKAKEVVGEILQFGDSDQSRLKAAELTFKVEGSFAPEKRVNVNLDGTPTERTRELGNRLLKLLGR